MPERLTCPFCGWESVTEGEAEMVQHIERNHAEDHTASASGTTEPPEGQGSLLDHRSDSSKRHRHEGQHVATDRASRSPSGSSRTMSRPSATPPQRSRRSLEEGTAAHRDRREGHESRRAHPQNSRRRTTVVRSSSSQPSVIQAWKELFNGARSSRGAVGGSGGSSSSRGTSDGKRVRHRTKLDDKLQQSSTTSPWAPRTATQGSRGSKETPRTPIGVTSASTKLGRSELGRHYKEKTMPSWLVSLLQDSEGVCNKGIIPVLEQLLEQSPTTEYAYVCSPCTQHISKLRREGSFCGYRNIQMLASYIIASGAKGAELFGDTFPTIFQIQDLVEHAWDAGYNTQGREETGGIRGTRKYIGTPEAQALFSSLSIPCPVQAFKDGDRARARTMLMRAVEAYFRQSDDGAPNNSEGNSDAKVRPTGLPPIYLQHRGHSLTVVGFEKQRDKQVNLLVFDPSFRDASSVRDLVGRTFTQSESKVNGLLEPYRRGTRYFRRYGEFEVLYLTDTAPPTNT